MGKSPTNSISNGDGFSRKEPKELIEDRELKLGEAGSSGKQAGSGVVCCRVCNDLTSVV